MSRVFALVAALALPAAALAQPLGTAFTYQGRLNDGGSPAQGTYDFQFILYDAVVGGAQVGPLLTRDDVAVSSGLFTLSLDFGAVFGASKRWLEIGVRPGASTGVYTPLAPRQELSAAPAALYSERSALTPWTGITGVPAGFADGVDHDSGGTVTSVTAGAGLTGGTITTSGALAVAFAGVGSAASAARSDHHHDGAYAAAAHDHFGAAWTGAASPGLSLTTSGAVGLSGTGSSRGVWGVADHPTGVAYGVLGTSASVNGRGVFGQATAASGLAYGVQGETTSPSAAGVWGRAMAPTGLASGVFGSTASPSGRGVTGQVTATSGQPIGVRGDASSAPQGIGVSGESAQSWGIYGETVGGGGVAGRASATTGSTVGVQGTVFSTTGTGVRGESLATSGLSYGVYGDARSAAGYAGYFSGRAHVTGTLSKGGGSFKIDHPLDPENKYLYHSFVESPDMMNVYNGNVTTDAAGLATVELPEWFEALNRDFRYQLTVIGGRAGRWPRWRARSKATASPSAPASPVSRSPGR